jgi:hypothetical protein
MRVVTLYYVWHNFIMPEPILILRVAYVAPLYHT